MVTGKCTDVFRGTFLLFGRESWDVWGGGVYVGGYFHGKNSHGGMRLSMKGAQDFLALFKKKQWKNKYEKCFSTESEEQH